MASELPDYGEPDRLYDGSHPLQECDPSDKYISDGAATRPTLEIRHAQAEHDARIPGTFVVILCDKRHDQWNQSVSYDLALASPIPARALIVDDV
jgi:hypothetical protein